MKKVILSACSDLGVHVDGSDLGPIKLLENINIENHIIYKENIIKSKNPNDFRKNEKYINNFTKKIFDCITNILSDENFPILIGGDHSTAIGSALASQNYYNNLGIIWIDAHGDYNTFKTTKTGNIHGLPLAAITGYQCNDLTDFITNNHINPKKCVLVGARSIDPWEIGNMIDAGVTIYTTKDIKEKGATYIMEKAIEIATNNTNGMHISYDLDVIDPNIAPGVSIPEENGINDKEAYEIMDVILSNKNKLKSLDIVEYNPAKDVNDKTKNIALKLLNEFIEKY